jgi:hypothetical protein
LQLSTVIPSLRSVDQGCVDVVSRLLSEVQRHVIKIRYADLPGGLHARAEARGRHTVIIYLLPGLTVAQRRAVLRRLRSSARVGHGPLLSRAGMARAMAADRIRTNLRNAAAALRVHPAILAPPLLLTVAAAVAFVLLVPVPVGINAAPPSNPGAFRETLPGPTGPQPNGGGLPLVPEHSVKDHPRSWVQLAASPNVPPAAPRKPPKPPAPKPKATATPRRPPSSPSATPSPSASAPSAPSTSPSPSPSAAPSASTSPAASGSKALCLNLVVTGVCF